MNEPSTARSAVAAASSPLYAAREDIYPRKVKGTFRRLKWAAVIVLLGLYYGAPWLRWDRGPGAPDQALLVDMPGRRAYFFTVEIWPQEVYYLTGLLIFAAIGLFLVTALAGRVWCGFTCPQTVWTDLFMWVERLIEGDRPARMALDKAPLSATKAAKKTAKHLAWLAIAFATGGAWIMYFADAPTLMREFFVGGSSAEVYGFTALFTATTYVLAGFAREQVCIYMCPWPRFQGAMFDEHSLIVTYEDWRGEPRGGAKHGQSFEGRGHCVDCGLCVQVCPTGVDIRKGQQMACIGCALCVDACNSIMPRFGLPKNLIAYDSIANQNARMKGEAPRVRWLRPRTMGYAAILLVVGAAITAGLVGRSRAEVHVIADRAPLFVRLSDGDVRNGYTVKILNMKRADKEFRLEVAGISGATMTIAGFVAEERSAAALPVKADSVGTFRVFVRARPDRLKGRATEIVFSATDETDGRAYRRANVFNGP
ncbi:MAG: cytochrome c oxidase accessory protein CcoG [Rhodospirillales bacterium]|nr:cytochrome c oxidase accessory protein CcoG [Rhodospirillales bacterium]